MNANATSRAGLASNDPIERTLMAQARVMMVDDEPLLVELVKEFLDEAGYRDFIGVSDPSTAMRLIHEHEPDVLLLDLMMPKVSGFDILEAVKQSDDLRMLPVIVMTSASDAATKLRVLEMGATDFLAKPVDPSELVLRLRNSLASKAHRDRLSYFDWLTNLPNRRLFTNQLGSAIRRSIRSERQCALLQIDVSGLKRINETLGQRSGDRVIQEVAQRLQFAINMTEPDAGSEERKSVNSIARISGNEFCVLLPGLSRIEQAGDMARRLLRSLEPPFVLGDDEVVLRGNIGIAVSPSDADDAERLIQFSQSAIADARARDAQGYSFYSADQKTKALEQLALERDLRKAIANDEFELYYQPKVDCETNHIIGAEALIRWNHPVRGQISPGEFISLAEDLGLIADVGEWVLRTACRQAADWRADGLPDCGIAVNISTPHFADGRLLVDVQNALRAAQLPAYMLTLEITESVMMEDSEENLQMLDSIKTLGVRTALDDFGTGFSSLTYLRRMRIDEIKVDRSFVSGIPNDSDSMAIVRAVIAMSQGLGLDIVAEGVEHEDQRDFLRRFNCQSYQGFLMSQPITAAKFATLLRTTFIPEALDAYEVDSLN